MIEAAGGLLWRDTRHGRELAVIYRTRYGDWTLPKGKRQAGETPEQTALREVFEETGCVAEIGAFAGELRYRVGTEPKRVRFWHMKLVRLGRLEANDEVGRVEWMSPEDALQRLDYPDEARLLRDSMVHD